MPSSPIQHYGFGQQKLWEAIRRSPARFTSEDLERASRLDRRSINQYLTALKAAGYVEETGKEPLRHGTLGIKNPAKFRCITWRLIKDCGVDAPRLQKDGTPVVMGRAREQMWRTMKIIGAFTFRHLAISATTEECVVNEADAKDYVKFLFKAGYLTRVTKGGPALMASYRLVPSRYSGPRPPQVLRTKAVFDANLKRVVWTEYTGAIA